MKKSHVLLLPFATFLFTLLLGSADAKQPNILYIFTDDQSLRTVSCYDEAYQWAHTPNIDRLAKSGVRFTTCYTGTWCQPSRATMLAGKQQYALKSLRITKYPLASYSPEELPFWPATFRKEGYYTACIGKWHLGTDVGHGRDWDHSIIWDRKDNAGAYYNGTKVRFNGSEERVPLGGYSTDKYTEYAEEFIRTRAKQEEAGKPWFLWLCYGGVHGPYTPAKRHADLYAEAPKVRVPKDIYPPRPRMNWYTSKLATWKKNEQGDPAKGRTTLDAAVKKYCRAVASLDEAVGRLEKVLEQTGQRENTLVVFTSDQGYAWGQHGYAAKWAPYDSNLLAPLIFSMPGTLPKDAVCRLPVNGIDITRTFFAMAGIKPAWKMHGRDFSDWLKNPQKKGEPEEPMLLCNTIWNYGDDVTKMVKSKDLTKFTDRRGMAWLMYRKGKYKYIRFLHDDAIEELYDLEKDPKELWNLSVDAKHHQLLLQLRKEAAAAFARQDCEWIDDLPEPKLKEL